MASMENSARGKFYDDIKALGAPDKLSTFKNETCGGASVGIGGAPTRATTIATTSLERKHQPVASGVLDYFPDALVAVAQVSWAGNEQHNPGQPLHWARGKSADEADALIRHFLERGGLDSDGFRHSAKMAWRALALLQKEIEAESQQLFTTTELRQFEQEKQRIQEAANMPYAYNNVRDRERY